MFFFILIPILPDYGIFYASTDCFSGMYTDFSHYHLATLGSTLGCHRNCIQKNFPAVENEVGPVHCSLGGYFEGDVILGLTFT